ncbi:MAG TPA: TetR family transcriptional regulator [Streptosporangiaceae bacterium]|nr:TetR family transcriptional regulator [Streptosporangiaceae bacterium]
MNAARAADQADPGRREVGADGAVSLDDIAGVSREVPAGRRGGPASGSPAGRVPRRGHGGRRSGDSGTREAILDAARAQFAERGYHGATIRAIAAVAEVDPALVHHFYGTKEALFAAAMRLPVVPSEVLAAALARDAWATGGDPAAGLGEHLVRTALGLWESDQMRETFVGLLRSAVTSDQAAVMLREFIADSILSTVARAAGLLTHGSSAEADFRAAMVATQMLGLALTRLVLALPPIAGASVDDLAVTVGPTIERYLTGEIRLPERRAGQHPRTGQRSGTGRSGR